MVSSPQVSLPRCLAVGAGVDRRLRRCWSPGCCRPRLAAGAGTFDGGAGPGSAPVLAVVAAGWLWLATVVTVLCGAPRAGAVRRRRARSPAPRRPGRLRGRAHRRTAAAGPAHATPGRLARGPGRGPASCSPGCPLPDRAAAPGRSRRRVLWVSTRRQASAIREPSPRARRQRRSRSAPAGESITPAQPLRDRCRLRPRCSPRCACSSPLRMIQEGSHERERRPLMPGSTPGERAGHPWPSTRSPGTTHRDPRGDGRPRHLSADVISIEGAHAAQQRGVGAPVRPGRGRDRRRRPPVTQLVRWTPRGLRRPRAPRHARRPRRRHQPGQGRVQPVRPRVLGVHTSFVGRDVVEASVHVRYGERSRAVAARFERPERRWVCTALEFA